MTYKETLFFIGKCLTITHEEHNRNEVEQELKEGAIDWEAVVKVSTAQYVFPALYCNLKRANFLHYLPEELVNYMIHITDLNRDRNKQIIKQAKEINELLVANNITPIFLKGTGFLLQDFYEDIAERMVGDIDFIFSKTDYQKVIKILLKNNYSKVHKTTYDYPMFKHYPRLQKKDRIAAAEIHKELLLEKYASIFNYELISKETIHHNEFEVMSYKNQFALTIIAKQINDDGFYYKNISLRNAYDVFLLSKKVSPNDAIKNLKTLYNPLNCFVASCFEVFNKPKSLIYHSTKNTEKYLLKFHYLLANKKEREFDYKKQKIFLFLKVRSKIILNAFYKKEYTVWVFKRMTDKSWYQEKFNTIFSKPTP